MPTKILKFDELLVDAASFLEPSDRDRQVADNRYRLLKEILERPTSPFKILLSQINALIYAQGSVATSTVVLSGTDDDRFDVDAIVQCDYPASWTPAFALDQLFETLKNFPGAVKVVRCTRCVQVQFAFMHMDVTLLDRTGPANIEHAGEIFHANDDGVEKRVDANPYGFAHWFRARVATKEISFSEFYSTRIHAMAQDRLVESLDERRTISLSEQSDLPPFLPARLDTVPAVALKLLKRYVNLQYERLTLKRPPSIFLAKLTGDLGEVNGSLCDQLIGLARFIDAKLQQAMTARALIVERNPTYERDVITDRWPATMRDMEVLAGRMTQLVEALTVARSLDLKGMVDAIEKLFGEKVAAWSKKGIIDGYDDRDSAKRLTVDRAGTVLTPSAAAAFAVPKSARAVPSHNFHCGKKDDED